MHCIDLIRGDINGFWLDRSIHKFVGIKVRFGIRYIGHYDKMSEESLTGNSLFWFTFQKPGCHPPGRFANEVIDWYVDRLIIPKFLASYDLC